MTSTNDYSTRVPPEMHLLWLDCLPESDLKNLRLVNKRWGAFATAVLWSHLRVDLARIDSTKIDALLKSSFDGIRNNIKVLTITTRREELLEVESMRRATFNLTSLLDALPRDCLKAFISPRFKLSHANLDKLFSTQSHLSDLTLFVREEFVDTLCDYAYLQANVERLHKLKLYISKSTYHTCQGISSWLFHTRGLRELCINGVPYSTAFKNMIPPVIFLPKLRVLSLNKLHLPHSGNTLADDIDLLWLQKLEIKSCHHAASLLKSLARKYQEAGFSSLETFTFQTLCLTLDAKESLEEFLGTTNGLQELSLSLGTGHRLDLNSLARTGKSLQRLKLFTEVNWMIYNASEMDQLIRKCPNLLSLHLNIGDLSRSTHALSYIDLARHSDFVDVEASLKILAKHSTLKRLLITVSPLYTPATGQRYQRVARAAMQCLAENGSKVSDLRFPPLECF